MKKLLLLLAATSCCYLQTNATPYVTLSAVAVSDDITSIPKPDILIGYDVFFSNFYIAYEQLLVPNMVAKMSFKNKADVMSVQLGYKIIDNIVLFIATGASFNSDYDTGICFSVGVKYFDNSNNNLVYRAMWQNFDNRKFFILGVDYRI